MKTDLQAQEATFLAAERPLLAALIALGLFLGGGVTGMVLANSVAPDSGVTAAVSVLALPGAFLLSLFIWQGFTFLFALPKLIRHGRQENQVAASFAALARKAWLLVPLPIIFATFAGLIAAVLGDWGFFRTLLTYCLCGILYGMCCYLLGRSGRLPMLDD